MEFTYFSQICRGAVKYAGSLFFIFFVHTLGILLFYFYVKTGHYADSKFIAISFIQFLLGFVLSFFFPGKEFFFASFGALTLPRVASIYSGKSSHNTLFPFFFGLSAGVVLRLVYFGIRRREMPLFRVHFTIVLLAIFGAVLIFRAFCDYYSPYVFIGYPFADLEIGPGVSSNYAFHLSLTIVLNMLAPLLFLASISAGEFKNKNAVAEQIFYGFLFSFFLNLVVIAGQIFGISRLYAGSALSLEANRLPGLFSDSGSSSVIFPLLFYVLYIYLSQKIAKIKQGYFSRDFVHYLFVIFFVAATVLFGKTQGRGYYLTLFVPLILASLHLKNSVEKSEKKFSFFYFLILSGTLLVGVIILIIKFYHFPALDRLSVGFSKLVTHFLRGDLKNGFETFDSARTRLFLAGWEIFKEYPWMGSGPNSFMVETARLRKVMPDIPVDSPVNFYLGLLSDIGILGSAFVLIVAMLYGSGIIASIKENNHPYFFSVIIIPIYLAFPLLYGYHIVHPEICVLLLFPFALLSRDVFDADETGISKRAVSVWLLLILIIFLFDLAAQIKKEPPSYWRTNRTVLPQFHPDFTKSYGESQDRIYFFRKERNFALAFGGLDLGEDGLITIFIPEKQDLHVACKMKSGSYEPINSRRNLGSETMILDGVNYVQKAFLVSALCNETGEPEIQIRLIHAEGVRQFGIVANSFFENRLLAETIRK